MAIGPGSRLGPYEVTALLGEGGMGKVWRAHHTGLKRDDALKVLPDAFASDPDRLARFQREAQVLASLNHPNIAHVYGLERADGVQALVMELVEGPMLADRIAQGPIPVDEALPIAKQIAEGLEAAHERGIIHRDLKPANIKLRLDGTVKVLDFGLAKALEPMSAANVSATASPTITSPAMMTGVGVLLGTAAYMSPEQARGKPADKRADIWAFGCVVYEMLTGKRAFDGEDVAVVLASVIKGEPDWAALPAETPPSIRVLLKRCLEKDRRERVAESSVMLFVIKEQAALSTPTGTLDADSVQTETDAAVARVRRDLGRSARRRLAGVAAGAVLLVGIATTATWLVVRPPPPRLSRLAMPTTASPALGIATNSHDIVISPDGGRVVYSTSLSSADPMMRKVGRQQAGLAVRSLSQLTAAPLQTGPAVSPFISPDNAWVGYMDPVDRMLKKVPISGGPPVPIGPESSVILGATWGPDDTIIYGTISADGLWRISAAGGKPIELTKPALPSQNHVWPEILPGGRAVLFTIRTGAVENSQIALLNLDTGAQTMLIEGGSFPRYSPTGHIVYGIGGALRAVGFDLERLAVTTAPVNVIDGVLTKDSGAADFDIADDGTLVYVPAGSTGIRRTPVWVDRDGRQEPLAGLAPGVYRSVQVSSDGARVAFESGQIGAATLWTYDVERATRNPLTTGQGDYRNPVWTPDGRRIVFGSNREGPWGLFWVNADGTGEVERLMSDPQATNLVPHSWSIDGKTLLFNGVYPGRNTDIGVFSIAGREAELQFQTRYFETHPTVSPDGRWLAYMSDRSGRPEVYVERFPELGGREPISTGGGLNHPGFVGEQLV